MHQMYLKECICTSSVFWSWNAYAIVSPSRLWQSSIFSSFRAINWFSISLCLLSVTTATAWRRRLLSSASCHWSCSWASWATCWLWWPSARTGSSGQKPPISAHCSPLICHLRGKHPFLAFHLCSSSELTWLMFEVILTGWLFRVWTLSEWQELHFMLFLLSLPFFKITAFVCFY